MLQAKSEKLQWPSETGEKHAAYEQSQNVLHDTRGHVDIMWSCR